MITLTRLLPAGSRPAPVLLARMKKIPLTLAQRQALPASFEAAGDSYEVKVEELRELEVDDLFMDDKGTMYAVSAAPETVYHVTGDMVVMEQVCPALMVAGFRVSAVEGGFGVAADPILGEQLKQIGLTYTEVEEPFTPEPRPVCGCHHHHHDDECGCGCGHHHHHHDDECCCGEHHHHDEDECCCGEHHHHDEDECCCGEHHHHDEGECCCGEHHHHDEGECCCGEHHHHDEGECCCGEHHHHSEDKKN